MNNHTLNDKLGELHAGESGIILSIDGDRAERLRELGFIEGARVDVLHEAPWSHDPIAVQVRGGIVALRREEANAIRIEGV